MDGTSLIVDLIPSIVLDEPITAKDVEDDDPTSKALKKIINGARPIVEQNRCFRVRFDWVQSVVIQEEFVELFEVLQTEIDAPPTILKGKGWFPFLEVENSKWRAALSDYQGGDVPDLKHFRMVSMETHLDVLGTLETTEWIDQTVEQVT